LKLSKITQKRPTKVETNGYNAKREREREEKFHR